MPEIKNQFTGGKMNKDVDERLVPKGEYRDAMNIQVSTSEGSDVGTVQNILGNQYGCNAGSLSGITSGSTTVGSVTDERTDSLYWFISGGQPQPGPNVTMRDSIWRRSASGDCKPVFVDNYGISLTNPFDETFNGSTLTNITSSVFNEIEVGWTVVGVANDGTFSNTATISSFNTASYIPFDFGYDATTTTTNVTTGVALNPMIDVASGISVVMTDDGFGNFIQANTNQVYLHGWSGGAVNQLDNDTIEIDYNSGNTYVISAAVSTTLTYTSSNTTEDVVMLTLDTNLIPFSNPAISTSQPANMVSPGSGLVSQYNGSPITALITSSDQVTTDVANGEIIFNIVDYDVTNATIGGVVSLSGIVGGLQFSDFCVQSVNQSNNSITLQDCQTGATVLQGFQVGGFVYGVPQSTGGSVQFAVEGAVELNQSLNLTGDYQALYFQGPRTLNFNHNTLITGIDIIDDMLFWTDNETEPKKINIERSIDGTHFSGLQHTCVINPEQGISIGSLVMAREKHITVIRKSPTKALLLELSDGRDPSLNYAAITVTSDDTLSTSIISSSNAATTTDFSGLLIEDTIKISFPSSADLNNVFSVNWAPGDYLLLKEEIDPTTLPSTPLSSWTIRGKILNVQNGNNFDSSNGVVVATIEIVGLKGVPPEPDPGKTLIFLADLEYSEARIFQNKFPRFSYRYKYSDGEYSTFAPWSQPAFIPTSFNYDPKKGWNTGMRNNLQSVKLKGFNTLTHADAISIDILYKDDSSTNVHIVQTISPIDILKSGQVERPWFSNEYTIDSENIKSTIPSGQLLRAWDGVPKKAIAQGISGNRIVYGNYEQGYDLLVGGGVYTPDFNNSLIAWAPTTVGSPQKSIKSLRDYKLGVVFTDKYGRETPVLISENGGFNVKKTESKNYNRLTASLNGVAPSKMAYYKFYIKETSSEYYNVPMDRWYSAEDGNIWLSLPSADRNKIDLDTFLYFKKGESGDSNVIENSTEYKVLDIDSEAPKWIKTKKVRIGSVRHNVGADMCLFGTASDTTYSAPRVGEVSFNLNFHGNNEFESLAFKTSTLAHLENIEEQLYIQFVYGDDYSSQHAIAEITSDFDPDNTNSTSNYFISLTKPLDNDINIIFDNPASASAINDDVRVVFSKEVIENTPHFDGRFFVKIENDGKIQSMVSDTQGVNYSVKVSKTVYELDGDGHGDFGLHMHAYTRNSVNYVMKDWCGSVTNGCAGWAWSMYGDTGTSYPGDLDNPGGNNYMNAAVRQSFTRDLSGATMDSQGGSEENGVSGVFFINRSNRTWEQRDTVGCDDNTLSWPDNNGMNHLSPACNNIDAPSCGANPKDRFKGILTNGKYINIGFAGIKAPGDDTLRSKFHGSYSGGVGNYHLHDDISSFYGVGTTNSSHNDPLTKKFVENFVAGSKFKWKEDPTETVYTIVDQTNCSYDVRFGRHSDGLRNHSQRLISDPSSYSKNWGFHTDKPLAWNPSTGMTGDFIQNGLHLGDATGPADHVRNVTADNGLVLNLADVSGIQVGMAVRHANIPLDCNVVTVVGNAVVISLASTGSGVGGDDVSFGFIIRVKGGSIYGVQIDGSTGTNPQENYLLVDRNSTQCSNGNNQKPQQQLHPGMALDFCNSDPSDTFYGVYIKKISEKDTNGQYRIDLGGGFTPLHYESNQFNFVTGPGSDDIILNKALAIKQVVMNGASSFSEDNTDYSLNHHPMSINSVQVGPIVAVGYTLQFLEEFDEYTDGNVMPQDPFIWETKPKNDDGIDIYYEISDRYAIELNPSTISQAIPLGSQVTSVLNEGGMDIIQPSILAVGGPGGDEITIQTSVTGGIPGVWAGPGATPTGINPIIPGSTLVITKPNGESFNVVVEEVMGQTAFGTGFISNKLRLQKNLYSTEHTLNWHNCYSFGNGVESNRSKDVYNASFMGNGVKVSSVFEEYAEERRSHGLIYSGIYNSTSGVNNLNQFSYAEKITKDINPIYGSIQKLYAGWGQGGDLVALCEDRVLKILANKDALYNADGNTNVTSTNNVLGQAIPYSGEYGISKNPESFASEAYRIYFTDKVRGTVMRLSMDGLTPISNHGMKDWFRDHLKLGDKLIGSYDDKKDEYNVTMKGDAIAKTVTFREDVKGWVSFKSFTPENAISCANEYYTFKDGDIWKHHVEFVNRNTFYGTGPNEDTNAQSSITVMFNDLPGSVKTFHTLNYEGSQSKIDELASYQIYLPGTVDPITGIGVIDPNNPSPINDNDYYNLSEKPGWYVQSIKTDLEQGSLNEFIEKEGKWFNYIKGVPGSITDGVNINGFNNYNISFQGLGRLAQTPTSSNVYGCTDCSTSTSITTPTYTYPNYTNCNPSAAVDDGSCVSTVVGCTDVLANVNYNVSANWDIWTNTSVLHAGACQYHGCTDPSATNYDASANYNVGCNYPTYGCQDSSTFIQDGVTYNTYSNYDSSYTNPCDGTNGYPCQNDAFGAMQTITTNPLGCCCSPVIVGCTNPTADNYCSNGCNTDDGSCVYTIPGCTDASSCDWDDSANFDDESCTYCNDSDANNYDGLNPDNSGNTLATCNTYCLYCKDITNLQTTGNTSTSEIEISWTENWEAAVQNYQVRYRISGSSDPWVVIGSAATGGVNGSTVNYSVSGLTSNTAYDIEVKADCVAGQSLHNLNHSTSSSWSTAITETTNIVQIPGCMDEFGIHGPGNWVCNFNDNATVDDGSCEYTSCTGCTNPGFTEFCGTCWNTTTQTTVSDGSGTDWLGDDGSCATATISGCTDATATNYDAAANSDDGSCIPYIYGCTDGTTLTYGGSIAATNYDFTANTDDGSCAYNDAFTIEWVASNDPLVTGTHADGIVAVIHNVSTAPVGINLQWRVQVDGSTLPNGHADYLIADAGGTQSNSMAIIENQLLSGGKADLCWAPIADYQSLGNPWLIQAGGQGATWPSIPGLQSFFNNTWTYVFGCTDSGACNFNQTANLWTPTNYPFSWQQSCEYPAGCDDPQSYNYDASVTCPDNTSCVYCETDPDVVNATLTTTTANNTHEISWVDLGTYNTNGTNTAQVCDGSWNCTGYLPAYEVLFKYKPPGGSWTTTWQLYPGHVNVINCFSLGGLGVSTDIVLNHASTNVHANTLAYNSGAKWKLKVKNICANCTDGDYLVTPSLQIQ